MISLKRLVYYIDDATGSDKELYMSVKDICSYFFEEDLDSKTITNRVNSQLRNNRNLFSVKKTEGSVFWRLSANGYRYLNKFKDFYNPITDEISYIKHNEIEVY